MSKLKSITVTQKIAAVKEKFIKTMPIGQNITKDTAIELNFRFLSTTTIIKSFI